MCADLVWERIAEVYPYTDGGVKGQSYANPPLSVTETTSATSFIHSQTYMGGAKSQHATPPCTP